MPDSKCGKVLQTGGFKAPTGVEPVFGSGEMVQPEVPANRGNASNPRFQPTRSPCGMVPIGKAKAMPEDVRYLLRLCEVSGDESVQIKASRLAAILRRLLELEAAA